MSASRILVSSVLSPGFGGGPSPLLLTSVVPNSVPNPGFGASLALVSLVLSPDFGGGLPPLLLTSVALDSVPNPGFGASLRWCRCSPRSSALRISVSSPLSARCRSLWCWGSSLFTPSFRRCWSLVNSRSCPPILPACATGLPSVVMADLCRSMQVMSSSFFWCLQSALGQLMCSPPKFACSSLFRCRVTLFPMS